MSLIKTVELPSFALVWTTLQNFRCFRFVFSVDHLIFPQGKQSSVTKQNSAEKFH